MIKITFRTTLIIFLILFISNSCSTKDEVISYDLVTSVKPEEGGEVTPMEGNFISDTEVKITATANEGYFFKNWAGASLDSTSIINLRMDSDKQLTAIFEKLDSDGDGIPDDIDECPDTPEGDLVDESGCSDNQKDTDNDGIADDVDLCTNTPDGETVDSEGCSDSQKDSDGDGVNDNLDQCDDTPNGETVDSLGCSITQTDTDGDGVTDDLDTCHNTPNGETVDSEGCSDSQKDTDGDGITDDLDQCQNTPDGETVDSRGCSETQVDTDGDTVTDDFDQCPNTPDGETVDSEGCSDSQKDTDGDGINDSLDQCDNTPNGETVDSQGCSNTQTDTDNDGVVDDLDTCPNTPDGETVNENGCSTSQIDGDGDGVFDDADQCIDTPNGETVDANGCSNSQVDNSAPEVISITISGITSTSFNVNWNLNEISKGYIQFGTSSGVYGALTAIENNFFDSHAQTVGGNNPFPLNSGTTYYWQIYVEDEYGNTGFSEEQTTTTLSEALRTYVPDDYFEQVLIDLGYDDNFDDYVLTENIESIQVLELPYVGYVEGSVSGSLELAGVRDLTGIEDFRALVEFSNGSNPVQNFDFSNNSNLEILNLTGTQLDRLNAPLDISMNTKLERLSISWYSIGSYSVLDLSPNINLKYFSVGEGGASSYILDKNIALETLFLVYTGGGFLDLTTNINLKIVQIQFTGVTGINIQNDFNINIEQFIVDIDGCIQVDNVDYSNNNWSESGNANNFSEDCGY